MPADSASITQLMAVAGTRWSAEQIRALCAAESAEFALLAERLAIPVGFIALAQLPDAGEIRDLVVEPAQRCQGLGRLLLNAGLAALQQRGESRCLLEVRASNARALALYRRAGFQQDGLRPHYYPSENGREAAVLMSLELDQWRT